MAIFILDQNNKNKKDEKEKNKCKLRQDGPPATASEEVSSGRD